MTARRSPRGSTWLLRAFPRRFRERYAADIVESFRDRLNEAARRGRAAAATEWFRTAINLIAAGVAERRRSSLVATPPALPLASRGGLMFGWSQDFRYALRRLGHEPVYALFVVATLALGIGANVAVFSVVDAVLFRALPYEQSDRLVAVWGRFLPESGFDFPQFSLSAPEYLDYRSENRTMSGVGAWVSGQATVGGAGEDPERIPAAAVTPDLFKVLRIHPARGRLFGEADRQTGPNAVVLLSHGYWRRRFGGREDLLGQRISINGTPRTVIGVLPPGFEIAPGVAIYSPYYIDPANPGSRQGHSTSAIARLADGVSVDAAAAEMSTLMAGWRARFPAIHTGHFLYLTPLLDDTVANVRPILRTLLAATAFLLLIVCANVASLVLARAERRSREVAIRAALGSGRWRLIRLAAFENGLMAIAGGILGGVLAASAIGWLRRVDNLPLPRAAEIALDTRVWIYAAILSLVAATLLAVLPVLRARIARVASVLRVDVRTTAGSGRTWLRQSLVTIEVVLAVMLAAGAALMIQSFSRMMAVDAGFRTDRMLLANLALPRAVYDDARVDGFIDAALERIAALPGVERATFTTNIPLRNSQGVWDFEIEGRPAPGPGQPAWNGAPAFVRPGFFEALGIRLVRGRLFAPTDRFGSEPVAIVTETFAAKFFAGEDPIGRTIRVSGAPTNRFARIVGISGDVRDQSLDVAPRPIYFLVHDQARMTIGGSMPQGTFVLQASGDATVHVEALRAIIRGLDPSLPVFAVRTYDDDVARSIAQPRLTTVLLAIFAAFGLALGLLGVYGVLAYTVAERTHELGIRRALGARAVDLVRLVLTQGLLPVAIGIAVGIGLARAASGVLRDTLFEISPTDARTYVSVAIVVLLAALLACLVPMSRALRISPIRALREL